MRDLAGSLQRMAQADASMDDESLTGADCPNAAFDRAADTALAAFAALEQRSGPGDLRLWDALVAVLDAMDGEGAA